MDEYEVRKKSLKTKNREREKTDFDIWPEQQLIEDDLCKGRGASGTRNSEKVLLSQGGRGGSRQAK